ncbi:hypothetical protein BJ875DRAFT_510513, partial [Amylocarpus encephaloides]
KYIRCPPFYHFAPFPPLSSCRKIVFLNDTAYFCLDPATNLSCSQQALPRLSQPTPSLIMAFRDVLSVPPPRDITPGRALGPEAYGLRSLPPIISITSTASSIDPSLLDPMLFVQKALPTFTATPAAQPIIPSTPPPSVGGFTFGPPPAEVASTSGSSRKGAPTGASESLVQPVVKAEVFSVPEKKNILTVAAKTTPRAPSPPTSVLTPEPISLPTALDLSLLLLDKWNVQEVRVASAPPPPPPAEKDPTQAMDILPSAPDLAPAIETELKRGDVLAQWEKEQQCRGLKGMWWLWDAEYLLGELLFGWIMDWEWE